MCVGGGEVEAVEGFCTLKSINFDLDLLTSFFYEASTTFISDSELWGGDWGGGGGGEGLRVVG